MRLYIGNQGADDPEFVYFKMDGQRLEEAAAYCLGTNLGNRHHHLSRRASGKPSSLRPSLRIVELGPTVAHILGCYERWTEAQDLRHGANMAWEFLFPRKLQRMIVESPDAGIPAVSDLEPFQAGVLRAMRQAVRRWDGFMDELDEAEQRDLQGA